MQTEGKLKKNTRIKSGSNKTWVRTRTRIFFLKFSNSHQNAFPSLSQILHYQPQFLELPILWAQTIRNSMHLTFVYVSAILNCVYAIRSGPHQLSIFHRQTLRITFKAPRFLVALKGFGTQGNKTRQHNNRAS